MEKKSNSNCNTSEKEGQTIVFPLFPMPPSSNKIYKHFLDRRSKKVRRVSTDSLKQFNVESLRWKLHNKKLCEQAHELFKDEAYIKVVVQVGLHDDHIHTKKGKVRKMDVSNRGKALFDSISKLIDVDDCHFFDVRLIKVKVEKNTIEHCKIFISKMNIFDMI